jgi:hypothetical protein
VKKLAPFNQVLALSLSLKFVTPKYDNDDDVVVVVVVVVAGVDVILAELVIKLIQCKTIQY